MPTSDSKSCRPSLNLVLGVICSLPAVVSGTIFASAPLALAQTTAQMKGNIDDTWQGTLHAGRDLRTVLQISKAPDGTLKSTFRSIDQGGQPIPVKGTTFQGGELKLDVEAIGGSYVGKLSPDGTTLTGTWTQGDQPLPLIFLRSTPETAWAIPEPPPKIPPMAATANPSFDVATIKPSKPDRPGKGFGIGPRNFHTFNTTLNDLIMFSYGVQVKQLVNEPAWMDTDKFDLEGKPDGEGQPSERQWKEMLKKLIADRFQLKTHPEKRELSAYVLTVTKSGPKLTKSEADPDSGTAFFFTKLGVLTVRNATMTDFAGGMQSSVFDRPVVNRTGLEGHWDFSLKWTPDESQFAGFGIKIPPPTDAPDQPPPVFTAIQEQIGLKLDATRTAVDVMVVDHVERPSSN